MDGPTITGILVVLWLMAAVPHWISKGHGPFADPYGVYSDDH